MYFDARSPSLLAGKTYMDVTTVCTCFDHKTASLLSPDQKQAFLRHGWLAVMNRGNHKSTA